MRVPLHLAPVAPLTMLGATRALASLLLLGGTGSVLGELCFGGLLYENDFARTQLTGDCTFAPIVKCTDPNAANYWSGTSARRTHACARAFMQTGRTRWGLEGRAARLCERDVRDGFLRAVRPVL